MVKIVNYKTCQNEDGEDFFVLVVQGEMEAVKSKETGQTYFTARKARVSCTFDENTCKSLIGTEIPGKIKKVEVEPYEMINSQTGEVSLYTKRNVFIGEGDNEEEVEQNDVVENNLVAEEEVI